MALARTLILAARLLAPATADEAADAVEAAPTIELDWTAPDGCVTRDELLARTTALLRRPLAQPGDPELALLGAIRAEGELLVLRLEFRLPVERTREFRASSCAELLDAAAMVLAVTIDPLTSLAEPEPEPDPDPQPEPVPEPEPEPDPDPEPEPEPQPQPQPQPTDRGELGVRLRVSGGVQVPLSPSVAGGPSLALGVSWRALRAELVGALWLSAPARAEQAPEVGVTVTLGWVAPRLCGVPRAGRVEFPLCAGVELGGMRGAGFGTPGATTRTLPWVGVELGGAASVGLGRALALWLGVDAIVPLTRPIFSFAGLGPLHSTPKLGFAALLGLEFTLAGPE